MIEDVATVVQRALAEDIGRGDATTLATVPASVRAHGRFVAREELVAAGLETLRAVCESPGCDVSLTLHVADGDLVPAGGMLAEVTGSGQYILSVERVTLNFLMRLSGIATLTRQYVTAIAGTRARVVDTRKTTPGLRALEKAAVRAGGGTNHRFGLDDGILIKDNHLAVAGGITRAVHLARAAASHLLKVEVEVEDLPGVEEALRAGADAVLLDNMPVEMVAEAVKRIRQATPGVLIEVSGGVNLRTVRAYAEAGPDIISVGALTHSARAMDIGLDMALH